MHSNLATIISVLKVEEMQLEWENVHICIRRLNVKTLITENVTTYKAKQGEKRKKVAREECKQQHFYEEEH